MRLQDQLDDRFARRQWLFQRVGWALLLLVVVGGLSGFFGTSPLATTVSTVESGGVKVDVEYPRYTRYQHHDRLHVKVFAPGAQGEELKVAFSNDFLLNNAIEASAPEADGGGADGNGGVYAYKVEDWSEQVVVTFAYEPRKSFGNGGTITVQAGGSEPLRVPLHFWVHP